MERVTGGKCPVRLSGSSATLTPGRHLCQSALVIFRRISMGTGPDDPDSSLVVARATGHGRFQTELMVRGGPIMVDEPRSVGGEGSGPTPYELLAAGLAACTSMTIKLYAERKGIALTSFSVEAAHQLVPSPSGGRARDRFERRIVFDNPPDPEVAGKLHEIAEKCPVHRTLMHGFEIITQVGTPLSDLEGEPSGQHEREMEKACQ
jgi:putative redox protein